MLKSVTLVILLFVSQKAFAKKKGTPETRSYDTTRVKTEN